MTTLGVHTAWDHSASQGLHISGHIILNSLNLPMFHECQLSNSNSLEKSDSIKGILFWLINIFKTVRDLRDFIVQSLNLDKWELIFLALYLRDLATSLSLMVCHSAVLYEMSLPIQSLSLFLAWPRRNKSHAN